MFESSETSLKTLWDSLRIEKGSLIMVHSFLPSLGKLKSRDIVIKTLIDKVGKEGNIVVPTFTYSYFNNELYDPLSSNSKVGILGDTVRKMKNSIRSTDPCFSMTSIGPMSKYLMNRDHINSFGYNSIYNKLMDNNLFILLLGVDYTALSLFMHLEKIENVKYRHDKTFCGKSIINNKIKEDRIIHFARDLNKKPIMKRNKIMPYMDKENDCKQFQYAYGLHRYFPAKLLQKVLKQRFIKDKKAIIEYE